MTIFTLAQLDNCLEPTKDNFIRYRITCDQPGYETPIKTIKVDISSLLSFIEWSSVAGTMDETTCEVHAQGILEFDLELSTLFDERPEFIFKIEHLLLKSGVTFPPSVDITFAMKPLSGDLIDAEFKGSKIVINTKKPVINSFKINPSITRENTMVDLYVDCKDVNSVKIYYGKGKIISHDLEIDAKGNCSGIVKGVTVYDPNNTRFYLEAKYGEAVATENSVGRIQVPTDAKWHPVTMKEVFLSDDRVNYIDVHSAVLDIILNEYNDKIWVFGKEKRNNTPVCLWYSGDGLDWFPYKINTPGAGGRVNNTYVTIPPDLVHCPAVHFQNKIYFVGGSKVDIGKCTNTMKVFDYKKNLWLPDVEGPAAMLPRSMHACLVFPFSGNDNIWIIGGTDKDGNGLKDVWRYDGSGWHSMAPAGTRGRCRFGATVAGHYPELGKSIWIGGGVDSYDGNTVSDIWSYNSAGGWKNIKTPDPEFRALGPLKYTEHWLNASSICYLKTGRGEDTITAVDFYSKGANRTAEYRLVTYYAPTSIAGTVTSYHKFGPDKSVPTPNWESVFNVADNFALSTIGFNGCIWLIATVYKSEGDIGGSNLFYSCPE